MADHDTHDHTGVPGVGGSVATDTIWDAAGDTVIGTGANTAARLAKGTTAQVLVSTSTTVAWADVLPWHIALWPQIQTPDATTGTWARSTQGSANQTYAMIGMPSSPSAVTTPNPVALLNSNNDQNDAVAWDMVLAAGTWSVRIFTRKFSAGGIITVQVDGVDSGTVDTYSASEGAGDDTVTGISISTTGKKRINFKMATKNASSSDYFGVLFAIAFRRTA